MGIAGIICEYNPFHLGHGKQIAAVRAMLGGDTGIVCLMSGNYVQRGAPAIVDKSLRAKAAVLCGADLVLELPTAYALRSAEGFAAGGVEILGQFCDVLCFGTETGNRDSLMATAEALLSPAFPPALRVGLERGLSFPAARQNALEAMGAETGTLTHPNDILGVEYCKAILARNSPMVPLPIHRPGSYHTARADRENPSATAVRGLLESGSDWLSYVPAQAQAVFANAPVHVLAAGERAVLARLRSMTQAEFAALPYGSEGLWRKLMHAARREPTLESIAAAVKSKRYTRSRIDRMLLCAFLGLTEADLKATAPYVRVLALNNRGRQILKTARQTGAFPNVGETPPDENAAAREARLGDLYGIFCRDSIEPPGAEKRRRVYYQP